MGILLGIARHAFPKAPMELIDHAVVTCEEGIHGDYRGAMKRKPYKRQMTLIERGDWAAALTRLLGDVKERTRLATGARIHAESFGWDHTVDQLLAVYAEAVESSRVRAAR